MKTFNNTLLNYESVMEDYYNFFHNIKWAYMDDRYPKNVCYYTYRIRFFVNNVNYNFMDKVLKLENGYEIVYRFLTECCKIKHSLLLDMINPYPKYLELKQKVEKLLALENIIETVGINALIDKQYIEEINKDIKYIYKKYFYLQSTANKILYMFKRYRNNELDNSYYNILEPEEIKLIFNKENLQNIYNILSNFYKFIEEVNLFFTGDYYNNVYNDNVTKTTFDIVSKIYKKLYNSNDYYFTQNDKLFNYINKLLKYKYGITDKDLIEIKSAIIYSYKCKYVIENNLTKHRDIIEHLENNHYIIRDLKDNYLIFYSLKDKLKPILDNWDKIESEALLDKIS